MSVLGPNESVAVVDVLNQGVDFQDVKDLLSQLHTDNISVGVALQTLHNDLVQLHTDLGSINAKITDGFATNHTDLAAIKSGTTVYLGTNLTPGWAPCSSITGLTVFNSDPVVIPNPLPVSVDGTVPITVTAVNPGVSIDTHNYLFSSSAVWTAEPLVPTSTFNVNIVSPTPLPVSVSGSVNVDVVNPSPIPVSVPNPLPVSLSGTVNVDVVNVVTSPVPVNIVNSGTLSVNANNYVNDILGAGWVPEMGMNRPHTAISYHEGSSLVNATAGGGIALVGIGAFDNGGVDFLVGTSTTQATGVLVGNTPMIFDGHLL